MNQASREGLAYLLEQMRRDLDKKNRLIEELARDLQAANAAANTLVRRIGEIEADLAT